MTRIRTLACIALLAPLAACQGNAPSASTASSAKTNDDGFIARKVNAAMDQARKELATKNIDVGGIDVNVNGHRIASRNRGLPKAEITPQGDFLIEGKPQPLNAAQRVLLLEYRGEIIAVADAGMTIGAKGAGIADDALGGVLGAVFGGEEGRKDYEAKMEAKGKAIEAEAMKLCGQLQPMLDTQQKLATDLPVFKPYANMTQADIDDCRKHDRDSGVAVFSDNDRDQVREEIRNGIRESIRSAVRTPSSSNDDAADAAPADSAPALIEAADAGRITEVQQLVGHGTDVNAAVRGDGTALIRAAAHGDLSMVDELIRLGADVNQSSLGDGNPLIAAAKAGHVGVVARLLAAGADVNGVVVGDETPLINAARSGHLETVTYLVEHGADVNKGVVADFGRWRSPLNQAANANIRDYLTRQGAVAHKS